MGIAEGCAVRQRYTNYPVKTAHSINSSWFRKAKVLSQIVTGYASKLFDLTRSRLKILPTFLIGERELAKIHAMWFLYIQFLFKEPIGEVRWFGASSRRSAPSDSGAWGGQTWIVLDGEAPRRFAALRPRVFS